MARLLPEISGNGASLPKISIVTPSFRHAHYLEATLRSVADQAYPRLEHWVFDGGSTDGTVEILSRWEGRLAGWVSERDGGAQDAIQKGLHRATGDVCGWLNASDSYLPGALLAVGSFFRAHPEIDWICGNVLIVDEADRTVSSRRVLPAHGDLVREAWTSLPQPAVFWRRSLQERVGGFDPSLRVLFDLDLFARMARHGRFAHLPRFLARDRLHADSLRSRHAETVAREWAEVRRRYAPSLPGNARRAWLRASSYLSTGRVWEGLRDLSEGIAFGGPNGRSGGLRQAALLCLRAPALALWELFRLGRA